MARYSTTFFQKIDVFNLIVCYVVLKRLRCSVPLSFHSIFQCEISWTCKIFYFNTINHWQVPMQTKEKFSILLYPSDKLWLFNLNSVQICLLLLLSLQLKIDRCHSESLLLLICPRSFADTTQHLIHLFDSSQIASAAATLSPRSSADLH